MPFSREDFGPEAFRKDDGQPCLIDNPLRELSPPQLQRRADAFAKLVSKEPVDGFCARFVKTLAYQLHISGVPNSGEDLDEDEVDESLILLFRKAAQVAQNPLKLDKLPLSKHEKRLFKHDREVKFWNQPKPLRVTVVTLCFSAIVQGWIQSGGNGANQNWPSQLGIVSENGTWDNGIPHAQWIFAGVNAIPLLSACIFGCWLSDPLQSMVLGRRGAIFASALLCFASLIGSACTHSWKSLMLCRALVGLGMGAKASVTPIFGAETAPSHLRGALVMNWQLFDAFGIFLGFTANLILSRFSKDLSWRLQFGSACIPSACLLTLIWAVPESPRWLLKQRRHREAFKSLRSLRDNDLQAATELFYANAQLQIEARIIPQKQKDPEKSLAQGNSQHVEHADTYSELNSFQDSFEMTNYFSRIIQLFRDPRTRRATLAAAVVMISQQLCGMNVIAFYSSTFFRDFPGTTPPDANQDHRAVDAVWLSWGVGLANFIFTFPAYFLIDKKGRRFLLLCTYPGMILSMLAACLLFLNQHTMYVGVSFFVFVFVFFYSWGQGPVAFAYSSEVFPLINREAGMSFAVFVNLLGAGILTLLVPLAQTNHESVLAHDYNVGQARLLGIFVGFNVLATILIFFFVPETAGATMPKRKEDDHLSYMRLEELNYIFNVKTRVHITYQVREMLPYMCQMTMWWCFHRITNKFKYPQEPKKMWVWADLKESDVKDPDASETSLSSGANQIDTGAAASQVSRRSGVQIVGK